VAAGTKEAAQGAALAGALGALLTVAQVGWIYALGSLVVLVPAGAGAGWLAGRWGERLRPLGERRLPKG
jgi:hypothetical protein